jgi:hypothetical protein
MSEKPVHSPPLAEGDEITKELARGIINMIITACPATFTRLRLWHIRFKILVQFGDKYLHE